jgi:anthranilate synthase/aminodeoxychorismate synthase-like glutamine amidotransferase
LILVVDNYDSFVYNLVQAFGWLGFECIVRRNDRLDSADVERLGPSHLVLSPGPCTPSEAGASCDLVRAWSGRIPILGVCLGHQCIAASFGGRIERSARVMHGKTSRIVHDGRGVYRGLPSPFEAARYHSLTVAEDPLPAELEPTARTEQGELMGLRHREHPTEGVQFHPESYLTETGTGLLENFIRRTT